MAVSRRSVKREAMLALLRSTHSHPSAEWVYAKLRPEYPDLSLGTVYRNLRKLTKDGVIASVGVIGGVERFDANIAPHAHFVCRRCGGVTDVELTGLNALRLKARRDTGGRIDGCEVRFTGICRECSGQDMQDMQA